VTFEQHLQSPNFGKPGLWLSPWLRLNRRLADARAFRTYGKSRHLLDERKSLLLARASMLDYEQLECQRRAAEHD